MTFQKEGGSRFSLMTERGWGAHIYTFSQKAEIGFPNLTGMKQNLSPPPPNNDF